MGKGIPRRSALQQVKETQSSLKQGMKGKVQKKEALSDRVGEELATGTYEKLSKWGGKTKTVIFFSFKVYWGDSC